MQQLLGFISLLLPLIMAGVGAFLLSTSGRMTPPYLSGLVFLLLGLERLALVLPMLLGGAGASM